MRMRAMSTPLFSIILVLALAVAGCPKRPVATVVSAPAPVPPSAAAPPTPAAPAPTPPSAAPMPAAPSTPPAAPQEYTANAALKDVYFDFDKANIRPGDARILEAGAEYLKANRDQIVLIEGHCDERGTAEYNLALGERRAKAAMNYLIAQGVDGSRITLVSYGKERPVCTERTEACWALNRHDRFLTKPR